jgi:hypothetical protein
VRELLDGLGPKVAPEARYDVRVAAFLIGVAEREVASGAELDARAQRELAAFLNEDAPLGDLEKELSARLRRGELDACLDDVLALLLPQIADKARLVRPSAVEENHR